MARDDSPPNALVRHVEKHFGPVVSVFHELAAPFVHIDVHIVRPTPAYPYLTLVTSGMSERPMAVPDGAGDNPFCELMLSLPPGWPMGDDAFRDARAYWPVAVLKQVARLPREQDTWIAGWHTVPNGDPVQPYAPGSPFVGVAVTPMVRCEPAARTFTSTAGQQASLLALVPLHPAELKLKLTEGAEALADAFDRAGVNELLDPERPSSV